MNGVPYMRTPHPSRPQRHTEEDWAQVEKVLVRALDLVKGSREAEAELHDAAHWSAAGNGSVSSGKRGFSVSDMTGDVATSKPHIYMRSALRMAAEELPQLKRELKQVEKTLDKMERILVQAIPRALDSEMRSKLEHDEETARDYTRRHRKPA
jgi:hypothetical protein